MSDELLREIERTQVERNRALATIDEMVAERDALRQQLADALAERDEFRARFRAAVEHVEAFTRIADQLLMSTTDDDAWIDLRTAANDADRFRDLFGTDLKAKNGTPHHRRRTDAR